MTTEDDEKALRAEHDRLEREYTELRQRADDAESDADAAYDRLGAIAAKLDELDEKRVQETEAQREAALRERWLSERPASLQGLLGWLIRQPPPPKSRRLACIVQGGVAVSNGHALLHVQGPGGVVLAVPDGAEPFGVTVAEKILKVHASARHVEIADDLLFGDGLYEIADFEKESGAVRLDRALLRSYVLAPMLCNGETSVHVWVHGPEDPVVFKGTGWTSVVMPVRK